ncbi:MAG: DUF3795 domain-containing protein [Planctomycetes bacterium]|nr:DUF3795 domain-containing protein [Planctomycetota bacterium]
MSTEEKEVIVAFCGLACSQCGAYRKGKCEGCFSEKPMYRRCPIKKCNLENNYESCADCTSFEDFRHCKKLNNIISKIFGFIFRSNRIANLEEIRRIGLEKFKTETN